MIILVLFLISVITLVSLFVYFKWYYSKLEIEGLKLKKDREAKWLAEQALLPKYRLLVTLNHGPYTLNQVYSEYFEPYWGLDFFLNKSSKDVAEEWAKNIIRGFGYKHKATNTYYPISSIVRVEVV